MAVLYFLVYDYVSLVVHIPFIKHLDLSRQNRNKNYFISMNGERAGHVGYEQWIFSKTKKKKKKTVKKFTKLYNVTRNDFIFFVRRRRLMRNKNIIIESYAISLKIENEC